MSLDIRDLVATRDALERHGKALDKAWKANRRHYNAKFKCRGQRMEYFILRDGHVTERRALLQVAKAMQTTVDGPDVPMFPGGLQEVLTRFGATPATEEEAKVAYGRTAGILPKLLPDTSTGRILGPNGQPLHR